jgi:hypothetical protein
MEARVTSEGDTPAAAAKAFLKGLNTSVLVSAFA